jgi:hypothetical protein
MDVINQLSQLIFCSMGGKVSDLGFKGADQVGGCINDFSAESQNSATFALDRSGKLFWIWVQSNAQHAVLMRPSMGELFCE